MASQCLVVLAHRLRAFLQPPDDPPDPPCSPACPFCHWTSPSLRDLRRMLTPAPPTNPAAFRAVCAWVWARRRGPLDHESACPRRTRRRHRGAPAKGAYALGRTMLRHMAPFSPSLSPILEHAARPQDHRKAAQAPSLPPAMASASLWAAPTSGSGPPARPPTPAAQVEPTPVPATSPAIARASLWAAPTIESGPPARPPTPAAQAEPTPVSGPPNPPANPPSAHSSARHDAAIVFA